MTINFSLTNVHLEKFVKKLLDKNDIEDALKRLETLNVEEARMAIAETWNFAHRMDEKMTFIVSKKKLLHWLSTHP
jgi:hypothetical protein